MILAEIDPPIVLIVFVVISAIKWFLDRLKNKGEQPHETSESLEDIYEEFREEIRHRQTTVEQPVNAPPPLPQAPPIQRQARQAQRQPQKQQQVSKPTPRRIASLSEEQKAAAARFEQLTSHKNTHRRNTGTEGSLRSLLSNPQSTQQAIILLEVLGKPKSMQQG